MRAGINFSNLRRKSLKKQNPKFRGNQIQITGPTNTLDVDHVDGLESEDSQSHLKRLADTMKNRKSYMVSHQNQGNLQGSSNTLQPNPPYQISI